MDYGYQLLRHVVQQVFGNLGHAARLTLLLAALPTVFFIVTNPVLLTADPAGTNVDPTAINWGMLAVGVALSIVCWGWAAVAWHRFVLLEEYPGGVLPTWRGDRILSYLGRAVIVGLLVAVAALLIGIGIGVIIAVIPSFALAVVLGFGLAIGVSWVATRIGLILPAAAIGEPLKVGESWNATAPVSSQILLPILVIALVAGLGSQAMFLIFGQTLLAGIASAVISWLQLLVNLALMTTLYGNLIEGRQLN